MSYRDKLKKLINDSCIKDIAKQKIFKIYEVFEKHNGVKVNGIDVIGKDYYVNISVNGKKLISPFIIKNGKINENDINESIQNLK